MNGNPLLKMNILGDFEVFVAGQPVVALNKHASKLRCILCYLVLNRSRAVATSELIETFYSDENQNDPAGALKMQIVSPIARAHGVASVSLFGSYAKGLADAGSDVDLKIDKGALRSLFQLCGFRLAIEDALKLPVDLVTSDSSDKSFLDMIQKDEVVLYRNA